MDQEKALNLSSGGNPQSPQTSTAEGLIQDQGTETGGNTVMDLQNIQPPHTKSHEVDSAQGLLEEHDTGSGSNTLIDLQSAQSPDAKSIPLDSAEDVPEEHSTDTERCISTDMQSIQPPDIKRHHPDSAQSLPQEHSFESGSITAIHSQDVKPPDTKRHHPDSAQSLLNELDTETGNTSSADLQSLEPPNAKRHHLDSQSQGEIQQGSDIINILDLLIQPRPEYWCSITYFELEKKVGETFKARSTCPKITVDGYLNILEETRFSVGVLDNPNRTSESKTVRMHIGRGVQLELKSGGDVWLHCFSKCPVFLQSSYLNREDGIEVHKIQPNSTSKIFDLRLWYRLLTRTRTAAIAEAAAGAKSNVDSDSVGGKVPALSLSTVIRIREEFRNQCILRLSFVKGWGVDFPRKTISETPCWIEIHFHHPLKILDDVTNALRVDCPSTSRG